MNELRLTDDEREALVQRARTFGHEGAHAVASDFFPTIERIVAERVAAALAPIEALVRATEYRTALSLSRDFTGRPIPSMVPLEDIRRALTAAPARSVSLREPETGEREAGA